MHPSTTTTKISLTTKKIVNHHLMNTWCVFGIYQILGIQWQIWQITFQFFLLLGLWIYGPYLTGRELVCTSSVCPFFIQFSLKVYFPRPSAIILFDGPLLHPQHFLSQNCAWISLLLFEIILFTFLLTFFSLFYRSRMKVPQSIPLWYLQ